MKSTRKLLILTLVGTTALSGLYTQSAFAQAAGVDEGIDEIIVTGRGREESLTEVPISETVFDAQLIEDARIDRVDDFIQLTPGVTIANSQDSGTNFITIRGVSQTRNGEPPVAVLIDGILQVNSRSFDQALYDLESIEVLRGPQGSLYGRNATQGAIIINTKDPSDEFEGYIQGTAGRGSEYGVEGSISGPLTDGVGFRVSARYNDFDGIFENTTLGDEVGFSEEFNIRGHLAFDFSERFGADVRVSYTENQNDALLFTFQGALVDPQTGLVTGADFSIADANQVQRTFVANNPGFDDREVFQASLRWNYDFGWAELQSATAYDSIFQFTGGDQFPYTAQTSLNTAADAIGFPLGDGTQTQHINIDAISSDLRLVSPSDQAFRWVLGGYILSTDRFISSTVGLDFEQGIIPVFESPLLANAANPTTSFLADDNDNLAWALYFNFNYDVTDRLELTFGGRYDEDRRRQTVSDEQGLFDADGEFVVPAPGFGIPFQDNAGLVFEETFSRFQPKVTGRYLITDDFSVYASWGRGFRSGQFNQSGAGAAAADFGIPGISDLYDQENTGTIEAGFKSSFGPVRTSGAIYRTNVENAPFFVFIGPVGAQVLQGIDDIRILGAEFEASATLADGLDAYVGFSITDSEIQDFANPDFIGNEAPYVPGSTVNAGIQYRAPVTSLFGILGRVDYERRGEQFWDPGNFTGRDPVDLVNIRGGIETNDGKWSAIVSVNNLFDEVYNSEFVTGGFAHAAAPRIWRVDVRYNF